MKRSLLQPEQAAPRRLVDFHANASDFKCVLLAAMGLTTVAIAEATNLTPSQVEYRLRKAEEKERSQGQASARRQYRMGTSKVARMMIQQFTVGDNTVKSFVTKTLDRNGLYAPKPKGVLQDK